MSNGAVNGLYSACSLSTLITVSVDTYAGPTVLAVLTLATLFYAVRYYAAQPYFHWDRLPIAQLCVHQFGIGTYHKTPNLMSFLCRKLEVYINSYFALSVFSTPISIK